MLHEFVALHREEIIQRCRAKANRGRISARDLPGSGCVFTVDLPSLPQYVASAV